MSAVFADTYFFLTLLSGEEPAHARALAESKINRRVVTTEFILLELGNACARTEVTVATPRENAAFLLGHASPVRQTTASIPGTARV